MKNFITSILLFFLCIIIIKCSTYCRSNIKDDKLRIYSIIDNPKDSHIRKISNYIQMKVTTDRIECISGDTINFKIKYFNITSDTVSILPKGIIRIILHSNKEIISLTIKEPPKELIINNEIDISKRFQIAPKDSFEIIMPYVNQIGRFINQTNHVSLNVSYWNEIYRIDDYYFLIGNLFSNEISLTIK